jgi:hypothetical protein
LEEVKMENFKVGLEERMLSQLAERMDNLGWDGSWRNEQELRDDIEKFAIRFDEPTWLLAAAYRIWDIWIGCGLLLRRTVPKRRTEMKEYPMFVEDGQGILHETVVFVEEVVEAWEETELMVNQDVWFQYVRPF